MSSYRLIEGDKFSDERGKISFYNAFPMHEIVRFYEIAPAKTATIRAWQAHKKEKKWFYCTAGAFVINLIELDDFENPSDNLETLKIMLNSAVPMVLEISGGHANGFKATQEGSKLMVFSNFSLDESKADDFRYPVDQWSFEP